MVIFTSYSSTYIALYLDCRIPYVLLNINFVKNVFKTVVIGLNDMCIL
jgi:hypothetical protein